MSFRKVDKGRDGALAVSEDGMKTPLARSPGPSKAQKCACSGVEVVVSNPLHPHPKLPRELLIFCLLVGYESVLGLKFSPILRLKLIAFSLLPKLFVYDSCRQINHFRFCITVIYILVFLLH